MAKAGVRHSRRASTKDAVVATLLTATIAAIEATGTTLSEGEISQLERPKLTLTKEETKRIEADERDSRDAWQVSKQRVLCTSHGRKDIPIRTAPGLPFITQTLAIIPEQPSETDGSAVLTLDDLLQYTLEQSLLKSTCNELTPLARALPMTGPAGNNVATHMIALSQGLWGIPRTMSIKCIDQPLIKYTEAPRDIVAIEYTEASDDGYATADEEDEDGVMAFTLDEDIMSPSCAHCACDKYFCRHELSGYSSADDGEGFLDYESYLDSVAEYDSDCGDEVEEMTTLDADPIHQLLCSLQEDDDTTTDE